MAKARKGPERRSRSLCPACPNGKKREVLYRALLPHEGIAPHKYSVCALCYRKQWKIEYKGQDCPV